MSSPPESVISGLPKMWGMQQIQDLQARDGKLFQKEIARRLYSDLKGMVLDSLSTLRETTEGAQASYVEGLEHCRNWHPLVANEEMHRINARFKDLQVRVQAVSLLYGRILFAEQCKELGEPPGKKTLRMHAPLAESLVKGFFSRACTAPWVRNGSFWKMDPFQQDFVLREAFRDALAQDCVLVTVQNADAEDSGQLGSLSEEVRPEDSVSCLGHEEKSVADLETPAAAAPEAAAPAPAALAPEATASIAPEAAASIAPEAAASIAPEAPQAGDAQSAAPSCASQAEDTLPSEPLEQAPEDNAPTRAASSAARSVAPSIAPSAARSIAPSVAPSVARSVAPSVAPSVSSRLTAPSRQPIIVRLGSEA